MIKLYQLLLGGKDIILHEDLWELYKLGSSKSFNLYIIGIFICFFAYIYIPYLKDYTLPAIWALGLILLTKFGEYKGYNEALHELETNISDTYE